MAKVKLGLTEKYSSNVYISSLEKSLLCFVYHARDGIIFEPTEPVKGWKKAAAIGAVMFTPAAIGAVAYGAYKAVDAMSNKSFVSNLDEIVSELNKPNDELILVRDVTTCECIIDKRKFNVWNMSAENRILRLRCNLDLFGDVVNQEIVMWASDESDEHFMKIFSASGIKTSINSNSKLSSTQINDSLKKGGLKNS